MVRRAVVVVLAVVLALAAALALYARSVLASDSVRETLESQLTAWFGQPVSIGRAGASIFPRVALRLSDVAIGGATQPGAARNAASEGAIVTVRAVSVSTGLRGLFSRRIEDAEVVLEDGRVRLPDALGLRLSAEGDSPPAAARDGSGITIASVRVISLRNVEFTHGATTMRFDMESALTGDRLEIASLTGRSARTQLEASGALTSLSNLQGMLTVNAETLDLDELIALSSGFTRPAPQRGTDGDAGGTSAMRIALDIDAQAGTLAGYAFSDLAAKLEATPARIVLEPLALHTFGGTFNGALHVNTSSPTPVLRLRGEIAGIDVAALAETAGMAGSITGQLGGPIDLNASGTASETLVRSARGSAAATITDGTIPGLEMVRAVVLAFGKPSGAPPEGSGSAFTHLGGDFAIRNGVVRSDNLSFASRDFDMHGRAALVVSTGALDATTDVVLSKELTAQAGTDLRRYAQSDGRVILPARITGTIGHPAISLDMAAATRRALENELKRRAKSLLDQLFRRKKGGT